MRYLLSFVLGIALLGSGTLAPTTPPDLAGIVAAAKPAIVFIVALGPSGTQSGSGFVIASTATETTVVTANHVVEGETQVDVIFDSNERERYTARIIKRDHVRDVAVLSVNVGNRPALKLASPESIREGMSIALIGYPMATIAFKKINGDALRPSIHGGIVSAIRLNGELVQFDAATYHGDSGAPILDAHTGNVIAIVHGAELDPSYVARGLEQALPGSAFGPSAATIAVVLNGTSTAPATAAAGAPARSSSAYRLGYFFAPPGNATGLAKDIDDAFRSKVLDRIPGFFTEHNEVYLIPIKLTNREFQSVSALSGKCEDNNVDGVIMPTYTWSYSSQAASVEIALAIADCHGITYFSEKKEKAENPAFAHRTPAEEMVDMGNDLADRLLADFSAFREQHLGAWESLTSAGLAIDPATAGRFAMMFFRKVPDGIRVVDVVPNGPAERAGLRVDDIIASVDGKPAAPMTTDGFAKFLNNPTVTFTVLRPRQHRPAYAFLQRTIAVARALTLTLRASNENPPHFRAALEVFENVEPWMIVLELEA
ncbi:MAG: trypsin-like peptidase domain-containing protein [Candidatus Baltobacteraceae bacterium]